MIPLFSRMSGRPRRIPLAERPLLSKGRELLGLDGRIFAIYI
jgi:hypothetical protein